MRSNADGKTVAGDGRAGAGHRRDHRRQPARGKRFDVLDARIEAVRPRCRSTTSGTATCAASARCRTPASASASSASLVYVCGLVEHPRRDPVSARAGLRDVLIQVARGALRAPRRTGPSLGSRPWREPAGLIRLVHPSQASNCSISSHAEHQSERRDRRAAVAVRLRDDLVRDHVEHRAGGERERGRHQAGDQLHGAEAEHRAQRLDQAGRERDQQRGAFRLSGGEERDRDDQTLGRVLRGDAQRHRPADQRVAAGDADADRETFGHVVQRERDREQPDPGQLAVVRVFLALPKCSCGDRRCNRSIATAPSAVPSSTGQVASGPAPSPRCTSASAGSSSRRTRPPASRRR